MRGYPQLSAKSDKVSAFFSQTSEYCYYRFSDNHISSFISENTFNDLFRNSIFEKVFVHNFISHDVFHIPVQYKIGVFLVRKDSVYFGA